MKHNENIQIILDDLSDKWLGRYGVLGIFEEMKNGSVHILFMVKNLRSNKNKLPKVYNGYKIDFEETDQFAPHK